MTKIDKHGASRNGQFGFAFRSKSSASDPSRFTLKAVCAAALHAVEAFEESARRGDPVDRFLMCSEREHRAVVAACAVRAATPADLADKALLFARLASASNSSQATLETFAFSFASDAAALAKSIAAPARKRR
jgi:hypothetical protein